MFRLIRVPLALDKFFRPLERHVHWNHCRYFRLLVVAVACMWGRRNVANLYRSLDVEHHRTRFTHFFLVERWDPAAALRQKAQELLLALPPQPGDTISLMIDASKKAKRGSQMDAGAKMKDPVIDASIRGHQYVWAILAYRAHVIPVGIRLYVKKEHGPALGLPFCKTTELAAQLIREFQAPTSMKVMVLFDAYYLCHTVVQACRDKGYHFASTLKSNRCRYKQGWRLKAGRDGHNLFRRRRTTPLVRARPSGSVRYRDVDAGWLQVSTLGLWPLVFSRKGAARKILGLVTDDPELSAAELIPTYEKRWAVELFFKDSKQLLGLGHYQHRSDRAAVTHLHLVCFAYALLTHLRMTRHGAQGQRTRKRAAEWSIATAQDQLRGRLRDDLVTSRQEKHQDKSMLMALARLRVA
jgi:Transposase DDE domain